MKILITGGTGFIGGEICRQAVEAGHEVVVLARGGRPARADAWLERVRWVRGDVGEVAGWRAELRGCGAVVHCVGIIREAPARGVTFERINGEAVIEVATAAAGEGVGAFVFLSASDKPPLLRRAYLTAKRSAEAAIARLPLRGVSLRPGFVYGGARLPSLPAAALLGVAQHLPIVGPRVRGSRPLPVATVARAALAAATRHDLRGVLDVDAIERLGRAG